MRNRRPISSRRRASSLGAMPVAGVAGPARGSQQAPGRQVAPSNRRNCSGRRPRRGLGQMVGVRGVGAGAVIAPQKRRGARSCWTATVLSAACASWLAAAFPRRSRQDGLVRLSATAGRRWAETRYRTGPIGRHRRIQCHAAVRSGAPGLPPRRSANRSSMDVIPHCSVKSASPPSGHCPRTHRHPR
jgi:hypothetical protein